MGAAMKDDRQRLSFALGFAPDADPLAAGVVTDCRNFVPTHRGMQALQAPVYVSGTPATDGPVFTAQSVLAYWRPAPASYIGTNAEYAATEDALFMRNDRWSAWTDITPASKVNPTGFWTFTSLGQVPIGAEGGSVLQAPTPIAGGSLYTLPTLDSSGTDATLISGAPTCCIVTSAERFVLAFNGRGGDNDTWNCSARDNHASWTLSPSTLAAQGRLVEPFGPITAAVPMGNDVIAYKATAAIRGRFVPGDVEVWKWAKVPLGIGAAGPRSVSILPDGRHAVMNSESCWIFDGAQAIDVLEGRARQWFQDLLINRTYQNGGMAPVYDGIRNCVWFTFKGLTLETPTYAIVYHLGTGKLGAVELPADLIVETSGIHDSLADNGTRTAPGYFESTTHRMMAFGSAANSVASLTTSSAGAGGAEPVPVYIESGAAGDPFDLIDVTGIGLDLTKGRDAAGAATVELRSRDARNDANVTATAAHIGTGDRYAVRQSAHWHRVRVAPNGVPMELSGAWLRAAKSKSERGG